MSDRKSRKTFLERATKFEGDFGSTVVIIAITVLSFIVALAWRDTAKLAFEQHFPQDGADKVKANLIYSLITTAILVAVVMIIARIM